jgi:hypothetical protein
MTKKERTVKRTRSFHPDPDPRPSKSAIEIRTGRVSACGRRCVEDERNSTRAKSKGKEKPADGGRDEDNGEEHHTP